MVYLQFVFISLTLFTGSLLSTPLFVTPSFLFISGNLVTIIALSRSVKLRVHATTAFVISLCVSDLLFCSINLPLTASRQATPF